YRSGTPEEAAAAYRREVAPLPDFGLVHLGLGPDGHTASLFPGSPALEVDDPALEVVANADPLGNNPYDRVTLTFAGIARARLVVVTVAGAEKHEALARVLAGEDLPASHITGREVRWLVDDEAAGPLDLPR
ncbi:MAG TPA: 6-phosphogluconolactonase, partial [Acidimicrobiales bacterium]|nr:6-phosphogluconolactonase [Acidimicrobiales bacterium]